MSALRELMEAVSDTCEARFKEQGCVAPVYYMLRGDGVLMVVPAPTDLDKDTCVMLMRALLELHDVSLYVFADEAWTLEIKLPKAVTLASMHAKFPHGLEHAAGRIERLMITGESQDDGMLTARRDIIRPDKGKAFLGPLQFDTFDQSEGRMVGMLPKRGKGH